MSEHPTPWFWMYVCESAGETWFGDRIFDGEAGDVTFVQLRTPQESHAVCDRIVNAVNNHEAYPGVN